MSYLEFVFGISEIAVLSMSGLFSPYAKIPGHGRRKQHIALTVFFFRFCLLKFNNVSRNRHDKIDVFARSYVQRLVPIKYR